MSSHQRDRFGQRPLYYAAREGRLFCAERVDDLLREAGLPRVIDPRSAAAALCGSLTPPETLFRGVGCVPPGWSIDMVEGRVELRPLAPLATEAPLLDALRAAVRRMSAGAGCALSGGLDSGLVLALMSEGVSPVRAYTLATGFSDERELASARALAKGCGASHALVEILEDSLPDHFDATVRACEAPIWNGLAVARHLFFREVRKRGETALLSGVGADELLCGNPAAMLSWRERRRDEREAAEAILTDAARRALAHTAGECGDLDSLRRAFFESLLPESTLPPECRASAAEGVQARLPFLDPAFAAAALRLPATACVRDGLGKQPLREAARGLVPEEVRCAPKTARLAPAGGGSGRARRRWLELCSEWLRHERLHPLECVDSSRASVLLERFGERPHEDAVLLRLVSLAILAANP